MNKFKKTGIFDTVMISFLVVFLLMVIMLLLSDVLYIFKDKITFKEIIDIISSKDVVDGFIMSILSSSITLIFIIIFSIPVGYALSRYSFRGHSIINTMIDVPIILPPVVIGISLLTFFGSPYGIALKAFLKEYNISVMSIIGIVLCQFLVSVSYCIRAVKTAFDEIDKDYENIAMSLGCSKASSFFKVSLPLAKHGIIAGIIIAWARAIGVFGPLMVFVGTSPRVTVMPTAIWLQINIGNTEKSIIIALIMVLISSSVLALAHFFMARNRRLSNNVTKN